MICPECGGRSVEFRFSGRDTQHKICSRYAEPGHLTKDQIRERIAEERERHRPSSGRFA
jgi:hypothetical protein